jgi:hypothetical protein
VTLLHHVVDSSWGSNNDVSSFSQDLDVFFDTCTTNTCMHNDAHVLSDGLNNESNLE